MVCSAEILSAVDRRSSSTQALTEYHTFLTVIYPIINFCSTLGQVLVRNSFPQPAENRENVSMLSTFNQPLCAMSESRFL